MFAKGFMLNSETGLKLYEQFAKDAPIYDYHCHLPAKEIYEDKVFNNISELCLGYDHYKWRALRYAGVSEYYITGEASYLDKFKMWAKTCERLVGCPLHHWTNMELNKYFGVDEFLKEENAEKIYDYCNSKIKSESISPRKILNISNVKLVCTTDDPIDDLKYHKMLAKEKLEFKVLPAFRPDKVLNINAQGFKEYIEQLANVTEKKIGTYEELIAALKDRIQYFDNVGCLLSDHSIENLFYQPTNMKEVEEIFLSKMNGDVVSAEEAEKYKLYTLELLASEYNKKGWVMQLHIGAMRNNNDLMYKELGADSGFDIMNDFQVAKHLSALLNDMNNKDSLPKTILYTLNSKDNLVLSSLPHCYPERGVPGKIQFGTAWWFNDHKEGIYSHLTSISNQGMLPYFIGMLTDSRSFVSYIRHDYFRRILCNFIGELVDAGEFEKDFDILKEIVEGVCYKNIIRYLGLNVES